MIANIKSKMFAWFRRVDSSRSTTANLIHIGRITCYGLLFVLLTNEKFCLPLLIITVMPHRSLCMTYATQRKQSSKNNYVEQTYHDERKNNILRINSPCTAAKLYFFILIIQISAKSLVSVETVVCYRRSSMSYVQKSYS